MRPQIPTNFLSSRPEEGNPGLGVHKLMSWSFNVTTCNVYVPTHMESCMTSSLRIAFCLNFQEPFTFFTARDCGYYPLGQVMKTRYCADTSLGVVLAARLAHA